MGTVHVGDVAMHNEGDVNKAVILMSDINQNVSINSDSIQKLQSTVDKMNKIIEPAIYVDNGNVQFRGETAVVND